MAEHKAKQSHLNPTQEATGGELELGQGYKPYSPPMTYFLLQRGFTSLKFYNCPPPQTMPPTADQVFKYLSL